MIAELLYKIRNDKKITQAEVCKKTGIDMGHISHIEKGKRNPSIKAIKSICMALNTPYQPIMYAYDIHLTDEQINYKAINHIAYNKVPVFESMSSFITCPSNIPNASIALKITDTSMHPILKLNSHAFIAFNIPLNHRDIGVFSYNNEIIIRRFLIRKNYLALRAENKEIKDIILSKDDNFIIIGKIVGILEQED